jgi:hypothetical protein
MFQQIRYKIYNYLSKNSAKLPFHKHAALRDISGNAIISGIEIRKKQSPEIPLPEKLPALPHPREWRL